MKAATYIVPAAILVAVTVAFLLSSFFKADPLIGQWGNESGIFEFFEDGTLTAKVSETELITGTWSRGDGDRVKIEFPKFPQAPVTVYELTIDGDELTVTPTEREDDSEPQVLTRDYSGPLFDPSARAKIVNAESTIIAISTQLLIYQKDNRRLPTTEQGLMALVEKPTAEPIPARWIQLFDKKGLIDPWGYPFRYAYLPQKDGRSKKNYDVWSIGPDEVDGTDDDIGNW